MFFLLLGLCFFAFAGGRGVQGLGCLGLVVAGLSVGVVGLSVAILPFRVLDTPIDFTYC